MKKSLPWLASTSRPPHSIDSAAPARVTSTNTAVAVSSQRKCRSLRVSAASRLPSVEPGMAMALIDSLARHSGAGRNPVLEVAAMAVEWLPACVGMTAWRSSPRTCDRAKPSLQLLAPVSLDLRDQLRRQRHVVQRPGLLGAV